MNETAKIVDLIFPMVKNREQTRLCWRRNAEQISLGLKMGKNVVYLTVGDPSLYSTWIYIQREITSRYPEIHLKIIPGIPSVFAFAAEPKLALQKEMKPLV